MRSNLLGRSSIQLHSLVAAALLGTDKTVVLRPLSSREMDKIEYCAKAEKGNIALDANGIDMNQVVDIDQATTVVYDKTVETATKHGIQIPNTNEVTLRTQIRNGLVRTFQGQQTLTLAKVFQSFLRIVNNGSRFGSWKEWNISPMRFIASVCYLAFGQDWVNQNFGGSSNKSNDKGNGKAKHGRRSHGRGNKNWGKRDSRKPTYGLGVYVYNVADLQQATTLSEAIPAAKPELVMVFGIYPINNTVKAKLVGYLPAEPMVSSPLAATPAFIRHDSSKKPATQAIINLIKAGEGDANALFKSPNGGNFMFTPETLEMMLVNKDAFVAQLLVAIAYTNGNNALVTHAKSQYGTFVAARTGLIEAAAHDYTATQTIPTVTPSSIASKVGVIGGNNNGNAPIAPHSHRELVGAGVGSMSPFGATSSPFPTQ